jgi:hypothetical protein
MVVIPMVVDVVIVVVVVRWSYEKGLEPERQ